MSLDPVIALVLRAGLSLLLGSAAWHKLRDVGAFRAALDDYRLLPSVWSGPVAALLIAAECGLAVALWLPDVGGAAALGSAVLLTLYAAAMAATLRRGRRDVDCGCAGTGRRQAVRPALVARNGVLVVAALLATLPPAERPLGWVDALTGLLAPAAAACLYVAIDGLLATGPRLASLARRRLEVHGA